MRMASRFCFVKKLDDVFVSPLRTDSRAAFPDGSFRLNSALAAAKLTSGTSSSRARFNAAMDRRVFRSARLDTAAS